MPRYNNPRKTWKYSDEFKIKAVLMSLEEGVQVQEVARSLDIHTYMLSRWRKSYREGLLVIDKRKKVSVPKKDKKELDKLKKLEKENKKLKMELDLLKKWQRYLAEEHQQDIDSSRNTKNI